MKCRPELFSLLCAGSYAWDMVAHHVVFIAGSLLAGGRGLHSSTSRLNVSAFCGMWGALRGS